MERDEIQTLLSKASKEGNLTQTLQLIKDKAMQGDVNCMKEIVSLCRQYKHPKHELYWFLKAADAGDPESEYQAGLHFANAEKQNLQKAAFYYQKAAEHGIRNAFMNLAILYQKGAEDFSADEGKAFFWYKKGAEAGVDYCMYQTGLSYEKGIGTEADREQAFYWYEKCTTIAAARLSAGKCYEEGIGTEKNLEKALVTYSQAEYQIRRDSRKEVPVEQELKEENVEALFTSCLAPGWPEYEWYNDFDMTDDNVSVQPMKRINGFEEELVPVCFSRKALVRNRPAVEYMLHQLSIGGSGQFSRTWELEKWKISRNGTCWTGSLRHVLELCELSVGCGIFSGLLTGDEGQILICR